MAASAPSIDLARPGAAGMAGARAGAAGAAAAAISPLRAWRLGQRVIDHKSKAARPWSLADAARRYSQFIGRPVAHVVWRAWELLPHEKGARMPNPDDMRGIHDFTGGAVRPDHFYPGIGAPAPADPGGPA